LSYRAPPRRTRQVWGRRQAVGPWGISVSANLTPDETSGLGQWSDAEIERAIRTGIARDGHKLFPPMPFAAYQNISGNDMAALIAYLRSLPAIE
jgi:hypothetical protein